MTATARPNPSRTPKPREPTRTVPTFPPRAEPRLNEPNRKFKHGIIVSDSCTEGGKNRTTTKNRLRETSSIEDNTKLRQPRLELLT